MVDRSPGLIMVATNYVKENLLWVFSNTLYFWYFLIFLLFGSAGIWYEWLFVPSGVERWPFYENLKFIPLITFSAPIMIAVVTKHILIGLDGAHDNYPIKTLRTFGFIYFIFVVGLFIAGGNSDKEVSGYSIVAVFLILIFQFFYGAKDKDYEDVDLNVSQRKLGNNKEGLNGSKYE